MADVDQFEHLRPLLFSIAYRILGTVGEAEDAVQETWLRYDASSVEPASLKSYLATIVTRVSIDVLRSARVRRETYVGPWFPEPVLTDAQPGDRGSDVLSGDPANAAELADSVSMAALMLLERLSPLERAVFVMREVFRFDYDDVAAAVGRSTPACRQPGAVLRDHHGDVVGTWALEILDGQIVGIRSVTSPAKLQHLGSVGDLRGVAAPPAHSPRAGGTTARSGWLIGDPSSAP